MDLESGDWNMWYDKNGKRSHVRIFVSTFAIVITLGFAVFSIPVAAENVRPASWEEAENFGSYNNMESSYDSSFNDTTTYAQMDSPERSQKDVGSREGVIFTFNLNPRVKNGTLYYTWVLEPYKDCPTCLPNVQMAYWNVETSRWELIGKWTSEQSLETREAEISSEYIDSNGAFNVMIIAESSWTMGFYGQETIYLYDIYVAEEIAPLTEEESGNTSAPENSLSENVSAPKSALLGDAPAPESSPLVAGTILGSVIALAIGVLYLSLKRRKK